MLQLVAITCGTIARGRAITISLREPLDDEGRRNAVLMRKILAKQEYRPDIVLAGRGIACTQTAELVASVSEARHEIESVPELCFEDSPFGELILTLINRYGFDKYSSYEAEHRDELRSIGQRAWVGMHDVVELNSCKFPLLVTYPVILQALLTYMSSEQSLVQRMVRETPLGPCQGFHARITSRGLAGVVTPLLIEQLHRV